MRLWHKDLIPVLPRQQLLGQWRECCLIAKQIIETGSPNHILVNKVMDYPLNHLLYYGRLVETECSRRGYKISGDNFDKYFRDGNGAVPYPYPDLPDLFSEWHNARYLKQCFYNLQEKYDCGGISDEDWFEIHRHVMEVLE